VKIAFLWSELSGYMVASIEELKRQPEVDVLVVHWPVNKTAPFDLTNLAKDHCYINKCSVSPAEMLARLQAFGPEVVLLSGWGDCSYLRWAGALKQQGAKIVCCMDTQWRNTLRQRLAVLTKRFHTVRHFDAFWVAGERAAQFAQRLRVNRQAIWRGVYTCDSRKFDAAYASRRQKVQGGSPWPRQFLFVGRYCEAKGIHTLLQAYQSYRLKSQDPWELHCAGAGPLKSRLSAIQGVVDHGFVQPDELADLFGQAGAFVLPSMYEPWGVVLHEAASSGLPIVCSDQCGASVELLRDGYNGYLFEAGNSYELERSLSLLADMSTLSLSVMSERSSLVSKQFSPELWAEYLTQKALGLKAESQ
jgi:glycosyltransferase involved in cell wall biosynthesis